MSDNFSLGVYVGNGSPTDATAEADFLANLAQFGATVGATPTYIDQNIDYTLPMASWAENAAWLASVLDQSPTTAGMIPVVGVPMASFAYGSPSEVETFKGIISGAYDSIWMGIVQSYLSAGFTTIDLRLGWEMNATWEPWSIQTPAEASLYVSAFQHIAELVHNVPGITVNVVWCPDDISYSAVPAATLYPGDQYVDIVATDLYSPVYPTTLYDWSTGKTDTSLAQWFANPVNEEHYWSYPAGSQYAPTASGSGWGLAQALAFAVAHDKSFALGETGAGGNGTTNGPLDEATFPEYLAQELLASGAPQIAFASIWDIHAPDGDWDFTDGTKPGEAAAWADFVRKMEQGDAGPSLATGSITLAPGVAVNLGPEIAALITAGQPGDSETITGVSAQYGTVTLSAGGVVTYTAPPTGTDTITYTVTDQLGDVASSSYTILVDSGPKLAAGSLKARPGATISLGAKVAALITPGLPGDTVAVIGVTALYGSATLGTGGAITYVAPASGTDTVTFTTRDQFGNIDSSTETVVVDPGERTVAGNGTVAHGNIAAIGPQLLALVTAGLPGDTETITAVSALHGSVTLGAYSTVSYGAPASGTDLLTYTVTDQLGDTATGTYAVTVDPGPKLAASSVKLRPGGTLSLGSQLAALITPGLAGDTETITAVSARLGTVTLGTGGAVTYIAPAAGGADTLTYTVKDQHGDVVTGTYTIAVDAGPTALVGSGKVGWSKTANLTSKLLAAIAPGAAGDTETVAAISALRGSVALGAAGAVTYAAPASGTDTLTYTVIDQLGGTVTSTFALTVDPGPTASVGHVVVPHGWVVSLGSQLAGLITPGLTGDTETITAISALHGSVTIGSNGAVTYAVPGSGTDTLTYTVTDQVGDTATATDLVTIDPGPKLVTGSATLGAGRTMNLTSRLVALITPGVVGDTETIVSITSLHGSVTLSGGVVTYTAPASGSDTLTYNVKDQLGDTASSNFAIIVDTLDPGPSIASASTIALSARTIALGSTLASLVSPGLVGDSETITAVSALLGRVTLGSGGAVTYVAPATGTDTLSFTVTDQRGDIAVGTYVLTIDPGPQLTSGSLKLRPGVTASLGSQIAAFIAPGLAGDTETITSVTALHGSVTLGAGGTMIYAAPAGGTDTLTYGVRDQRGETATGSVTIAIDGGPTTTPGSTEIGWSRSASLTSAILASVTPGLAGDTETITAIAGVTGSVTLGAGGLVGYTAPASGTDTLTYTVTDQLGSSTTGNFGITIDPGPSLTFGGSAVGWGRTVALGSQIAALIAPGLAGDSESVTGVAAQRGSVSLGAGGAITYVAPTSGTDTVTYTVTDQLGDTATGSYGVTIDTGATLASGTMVVGWSRTVNLASQLAALITQGLPGDTETITLAKAAAGHVTLGAGGVITYVAPASGTDTLTYTVTDQLGDTATSTLGVVVDPGPKLAAGSMVLGWRQTVSLGSQIAALITPGLTGDTETVTAVSALQGTISLGAGGAITYTAPGATADTIKYTVTDEAGDSVTGTYAVTVDIGPKLAAGLSVVGFDKTADLSSAITAMIAPGLPGDSETITAVSAKYGSVTLGPGGTVAYMAPASGYDTITYTVADQLGDSSVATYLIKVDPGPKVIAGGTVVGAGQTVGLGSQLAALVTKGLTGDTETVIGVSALYGTVALGSGGAVAYTAPASGTDTLTYTVADQAGDSVTGTYAITVDPGPNLAPGNLAVGHGQTVGLSSELASLITPGLPSDTETITAISATSGSVTLGAAGAVTYVAPASGTDTLSYTVTDQLGDSATGTLGITVDPGPTDSPAGTVVGHGSTVALGSLLAAAVTPGLIGDTETITAVTALAGSVTLGAGGTVTYTAPASGGDTLTASVTDQYGDTTTFNFGITVDPGPVLATGSLVVGHGLTVALGSLLFGLINPGMVGDSETITAVSALLGSVTLGSGGAVIYIAPSGGTDTLTYTVTDQLGDTATGSYGVVVDPGPQLAAGAGKVRAGGTLALGNQIVSLIAPGLAGDSETITAVSALHGSVSLGAGGAITYVAPTSGSDTITFSVTDQRGNTATSTDTIVVDPGPKLTTGNIKVAAGGTTNLAALIAGLITPGLPGDTETVSYANVLHGHVALGAGGAVTYVAPAAGTDLLSFGVKDQLGDPASANVSITIDPGPTAAVGSSKVGWSKTANLTARLLAQVTPGLAGDTDTVTAISALHGSVTLGSNGVVSYVAPASGTDTLTYTVANQLGSSVSSTYGITIDPGPKTVAGSATLAHNWEYALGPKILALVTAGLAGDTETITAASVLHGSATLGAYSTLSYATPASGTDTLTYTVTDQLGDTATGSYAITIDTGPKLATGSLTVAAGSTSSLGARLAALITPGLAGDTETITKVAALHGSVTLGTGGIVTYVAPVSGPDTISYAVTDQLGDVASGTFAITTSAAQATAQITSAVVAAAAPTFLAVSSVTATSPQAAGIAGALTVQSAAAGGAVVASAYTEPNPQPATASLATTVSIKPVDNLLTLGT